MSGTQRLKAVTWPIVFSPLLLLLAFITLAVHVRIGLGHWPMPMFENYHTTAYDTHDQLVAAVAHFSVYPAIPLWLFLLCFQRFRISKQTHLSQAGVFVAGWFLIGLYAALDPGQFLAWYLD